MKLRIAKKVCKAAFERIYFDDRYGWVGWQRQPIRYRDSTLAAAFFKAGPMFEKHLTPWQKMAYSHALSLLCLLCLGVSVGCSSQPAIAVDYRPLAAATIAVTPAEASPVPPPAPAPTPGVCQNCNGSGKLGDGTVSVKCPVCNGTGRITDPKPIEPPTITPVSVPTIPVTTKAAAKAPTGAVATILLPPHDATQYSGGNCANGQCGPVQRSNQRAYSAPRRGILFGRR